MLGYVHDDDVLVCCTDRRGKEKISTVHGPPQAPKNRKCIHGALIKAFQSLVELVIKNISTSAEELLCMVKSYECRYRAQDKPSQMQRRNRSILEGLRRMK